MDQDRRSHLESVRSDLSDGWVLGAGGTSSGKVRLARLGAVSFRRRLSLAFFSFFLSTALSKKLS